MSNQSGYSSKILRIDLTGRKIGQEVLDEATGRKYLGGTGIGVNYLYQEVAPGIEWNGPDNRLVLASGPLGGTRVGGSGTFSLVTRGPLTNGASSTQASGFMGAFLRSSGFDGIIIQGAASRLTYLYIHDGIADFRDATHLAGKDTWQTEELIRKELQKSERDLSVFSIGLAGENLVKFASVVGDRGHAAAHNGAGAVMGSKKLKAIAVARGRGVVPVADKERLDFLAKELFEKVAGTPASPGYRTFKFGTTGDIATCRSRLAAATLPIKNYTTNLFPDYESFARENVDKVFENKRTPCWACRFNHCRMLTVKEGPHAGYSGDEPEYEQWADFGPLIGQSDVVSAFVLSNEVDRLGMDSNEAGWLLAWLMECYEKGLLTDSDTNGVEMRWGNFESAKVMLRKIANRDGIGDVLAEGAMRGTSRFGTEAQKLAVYTRKGNTPRAHDHRSLWQMILDTCVSDTGTDEAGSGLAKPQDVGLSRDANPFSPEVAAKMVAGTVHRMPLDDCLGVCRFNTRGVGIEYLTEMLKAATGWDLSAEETSMVGLRVVNLLRVFNLRHGLTAELEAPSLRYSSAPVDGPFQGKTIAPLWRETVQNYYGLMGWDSETSKPLPETLRRLGLEHVIKDIW
ncbi:MAG: hypothetical protein HYX79_09540 [Chloroflexi bacterium]|nr:hypothetical protein [Chloroflexota bacterium]